MVESWTVLGWKWTSGDAGVAWRVSGRLADCDDISHKTFVPRRLRHKRREMLVIGCDRQVAMSVGRGQGRYENGLGERLRSKTYRLLTAI
jgi:hypothetical protein